MSELSVPCPASVRISTTVAASHMCPFRTEVDHGTVSIAWSTEYGETVELHALSELIRRHAATAISHEQWTADLAAEVTAGVKVGNLTVTSYWRTGGLDVSVRVDQRSPSVHPGEKP